MSVSAQRGARGFQKNPQDFSSLVGQRISSQQEYVRRNWHFLSSGHLAYAKRLSARFRDVLIDTKTGQFELTLG